MGCEEKPSGLNCPETPKDLTCAPFQLTKNEDACYIDSVVNEALNIGGADINVYKLLGVHEQTQLIDVLGDGAPITGGDSPLHPVSNAFSACVTEWRSSQKGSAVTQTAYIGYDFGEITLPLDRQRYGIETFKKYNIASIKIKQGAQSKNRVTKARIERSADGVNWYGVQIVDLPDDNALNTIYFRKSVSSRYWRIRPTAFNGSTTDYWAVMALEMTEYDLTSIDDVQDDIFQENRDRDYATETLLLKGHYDLIDTQTELTKFGIELPSQSYYITIGFTSCVSVLGRPIVIGDVVELPSEQQYDTQLRAVKKYLEITDVGWSTEGYTPNWQPTLLRVIAQPMMATQETQDIVGTFVESKDAAGFINSLQPMQDKVQDFSETTQSIAAQANTMVPERGEDTSNITEFTLTQIENAQNQGLDGLEKISLRSQSLYIEDGLPPNGQPYTEGEVFPVSPTDGTYHRLTYTSVASDIPPRLFKFSIAKNRWVYLETDRRAMYNNTRPILQEYLTSATRKPIDKIED